MIMKATMSIDYFQTIFIIWLTSTQTILILVRLIWMQREDFFRKESFKGENLAGRHIWTASPWRWSRTDYIQRLLSARFIWMFSYLISSYTYIHTLYLYRLPDDFHWRNSVVELFLWFFLSVCPLSVCMYIFLSSNSSFIFL